MICGTDVLARAVLMLFKLITDCTYSFPGKGFSRKKAAKGDIANAAYACCAYARVKLSPGRRAS